MWSVVRRLIAAVVLLIVLASPGTALDNGLARTPPMGWMSWERYACQIDCNQYPDSCINEQLYMAMADRLAADGFKELGYQYVNGNDKDY